MDYIRAKLQPECNLPWAKSNLFVIFKIISVFIAHHKTYI